MSSGNLCRGRPVASRFVYKFSLLVPKLSGGRNARQIQDEEPVQQCRIKSCDRCDNRNSTVLRFLSVGIVRRGTFAEAVSEQPPVIDAEMQCLRMPPRHWRKGRDPGRRVLAGARLMEEQEARS